MCPDGNIEDWDDEDLAVVCFWDGDQSKLRAALIASGWISDTGELHEWEEYGGRALDVRRRDAEKKRRRRNEKTQKKQGQIQNVQGTSQGHPLDVPQMSRTRGEESERRGEERRGSNSPPLPPRVEKHEKPKPKKSESVNPGASHRDLDSVLAEEVGPGVTRGQQWASDFPLLDVADVCADAWDHKARSKRKDMPRYLRNWLRREHERAEDRQERKTRSQSFTRKHGQPSPDNGTGYYPPGERFTCAEGVYLLPAADTHGNKIRLRRRKPNGDQVFWDWTHQTRYQQGSIWDQDLHEQGQSPWRTAKGQGGK